MQLAVQPQHHGRPAGYRYGCRCFPCKEAHASHCRNHRWKRTINEDAAMPEYQQTLRLNRPDADRVREFKRGEEAAYLGHPNAGGTDDYHAGYRLGLEERQRFLDVTREKSRQDFKRAPNYQALRVLLRNR